MTIRNAVVVFIKTNLLKLVSFSWYRHTNSNRHASEYQIAIAGAVEGAEKGVMRAISQMVTGTCRDGGSAGGEICGVRIHDPTLSALWHCPDL